MAKAPKTKSNETQSSTGFWSFLDQVRFQTLALYGLAGIAVLLLLLEFTGLRYGYTAADEIPAFYILYAAIGAGLIGLASAALRRVLLNSRSYYGDRCVHSEKHPEHDLGVKESGDV
ncbi:MAG: hypothetical protein AAGI12_09950 [Pseudomonadota bacterium]